MAKTYKRVDNCGPVAYPDQSGKYLTDGTVTGDEWEPLVALGFIEEVVVAALPKAKPAPAPAKAAPVLKAKPVPVEVVAAPSVPAEVMAAAPAPEPVKEEVKPTEVVSVGTKSSDVS